MKDLLNQLKDKVKLMEKLNYNASEQEELKNCIDQLQKFYEKSAEPNKGFSKLSFNFSPN